MASPTACRELRELADPQAFSRGQAPGVGHLHRASRHSNVNTRGSGISQHVGCVLADELAAVIRRAASGWPAFARKPTAVSCRGRLNAPQLHPECVFAKTVVDTNPELELALGHGQASLFLAQLV